MLACAFFPLINSIAIKSPLLELDETGLSVVPGIMRYDNMVLVERGNYWDWNYSARGLAWQQQWLDCALWLVTMIRATYSDRWLRQVLWD